MPDDPQFTPDDTDFHALPLNGRDLPSIFIFIEQDLGNGTTLLTPKPTYDEWNSEDREDAE